MDNGRDGGELQVDNCRDGIQIGPPSSVVCCNAGRRTEAGRV